MIDGLLKSQARGDSVIAGMLASFRGKPAFFYQKSPSDTSVGWGGQSCFPRVDYNIDLQYDPERRSSGVLSINVWCSIQCAVQPEDIEKRLIQIINGTFYTTDTHCACAIWNRSDAFRYDMPSRNGGRGDEPEVFGVTLIFDLMEFSDQVTCEPDPIQGLNAWTIENFSDLVIINNQSLPPVWKPSPSSAALYWRFEGMSATARQCYACSWYTGQFAAHIITPNVTFRNQCAKAIIEQIREAGEIILADGSPMFINDISIKHSADPLREGQLVLNGLYGVLRVPPTAPLLNNSNFSFGL